MKKESCTENLWRKSIQVGNPEAASCITLLPLLLTMQHRSLLSLASTVTAALSPWQHCRQPRSLWRRGVSWGVQSSFECVSPQEHRERERVLTLIFEMNEKNVRGKRKVSREGGMETGNVARCLLFIYSLAYHCYFFTSLFNSACAFFGVWGNRPDERLP